MRIFIAVEIPEDIKDYLGGIKEQLKDAPAKIRWVTGENMHLTLKFLGEVDEDKIEMVKNALSNVKIKKFPASISGIGVFPTESYIRVIWVGMEPSNKITELQQAVENELLKVDFEQDKRFMAHLTIARVKFIEDKKGLLEKIKKIKIEKKDFNIESFKLIKSTLTKEGPIYEELADFPLS